MFPFDRGWHELFIKVKVDDEEAILLADHGGADGGVGVQYTLQLMMARRGEQVDG